jgi:spoIIIJ-associated protein
MRVFVDIGNYRKKREETLINLAQKLAHTVRKTGKRIELEPMNAYERRILHCALEGDRFVNTYSFGDEPNRRIVVTLKENNKKNI